MWKTLETSYKQSRNDLNTYNSRTNQKGYIDFMIYDTSSSSSEESDEENSIIDESDEEISTSKLKYLTRYIHYILYLK